MTMLVLSRQKDQTIKIGDDIEVIIVDIRGDKVRLGITAPRSVTVHRKEVYDTVKREHDAAVKLAQFDADAAHASHADSPNGHTDPFLEAGN